MKCLFHKWNGCRCEKCGKVRNEGHSYRWLSRNGACYEVCMICGNENQKTDHAWQIIPNSCKKRCSQCGEEQEAHDYQPVEGKCIKKCNTCGKIQKLEHVFCRENCKEKCRRCGYERQAHRWILVHGFVDGSRDGCKCTLCGEMNPNGNHTWKFCKCEVCGKINEFGFDWQHDWEEIEEDGYVRIRRCRICG